MRIESSNHVIWRFAAYVMPALGAMLVLIALLDLTGVSQRITTGTAVTYLIGGALLLAFLWMRTGLAIDLDARARTLNVEVRRAYLARVRTEVPFDRLRAIHLVRTPAWVSALVTREDGGPLPLTAMLPRNAAGEAKIAAMIERARELTGRPLPLT
ncbi:MAG TPA: hypothetical protein VHE35_00690 [Kofleriaceae bacterium]|nr:hypothetical protein [Kofleriaceae bacterium]